MLLPHNHHNSSSVIFESMPEADNFRRVSLFFRQLGDPSRIRILWLLCHTEECVVNIAAMMGMSSPATVHHLKLLKETGLIESRKEGKEVYYRAADNEETAALHFMIEEMMKISCPEAGDKLLMSNKAHCHIHDDCDSCGQPGCIPKLPGAAAALSRAALSNGSSDNSFRRIDIDIHDHRVPTDYDGGNTALIKNIHDYLTEDLSRHVTIEDLSKMFHINTTTLKNQFKAAYGAPIATYMKDCRMKAAAEYLSQTALEVGQIADAVGYTNHGKFSAAFKEYSGMLPKQYRSMMKIR